MRISIVGTGYVGLVAATCFADAGHDVVCVDSDSAKVDLLRQGQIPFYEPGLGELFQRISKRMTFVDSVAEATKQSSVVFIAVGTPELPDGSANMQPTFNVLKEICHASDEPKYVVFKSTVPIGTSRLAEGFCQENCAHKIEIINNPEFLKQGAAVEDFLRPDRVVIGCQSDQAKALMQQLYGPFLRQDKGLILMDNTSAEMTKYAANAFLALKISFINELALLSDRVGADIDRVKEGFTSDSRINPAFFNPGIGYGGSCFPKDVRALLFAGKQVGLDLKILQAADDVNERQKSVLTDRLYKYFGQINGLKIALWGLSFKPRTDDVRRAPSIALIEDLVRHGAKVSAYDPVAGPNAKKACLAPFDLCSSALLAAADADALLVVTEWSEFKSVNLASLKAGMRRPVLFDGRNLFDPGKIQAAGFEYFGIGRQGRVEEPGASRKLQRNPSNALQQRPY